MTNGTPADRVDPGGRDLRVAGILLAAGAGRRLGGPKALVRDRDGVAWVTRAGRRLLTAGCDPVLVVTGASAGQVAALVPAPAEAVPVSGWDEGMGASLRAGLDELRRRAPGAVAVVVTLVDLPGVGVAAIDRLRRLATGGPDVLARAAYRGEPGHPVLIGRSHWDGVLRSATGDAGARAYLAGRDVVLVECSDVASGADVDTPADRSAGADVDTPVDRCLGWRGDE